MSEAELPPSDRPPGHVLLPLDGPEEEFPRHKPRLGLPLALFVATCASTFLSGALGWPPGIQLPALEFLPQLIAARWQPGLIYMAAVIGILLTHELGHFLQAVRYRVPASLPLFIPLPGGTTGTMGAVIVMNGLQANRRELFDIGISGPLAGLVVAIPIMIWGILTGDPAPPRGMMPGGFHLNDPLIIQLLTGWLRPELGANRELYFNPLLMAGWVGMLITGLNMMPVSQLDGGHVIYGLFGKHAHIVARLFVLSAIGAMLYFDSYNWVVMLALVLFIGVDHPPTRDDSVKLGPMRTIIGWLSLLIPIFCFTPVLM